MKQFDFIFLKTSTERDSFLSFNHIVIRLGIFGHYLPLMQEELLRDHFGDLINFVRSYVCKCSTSFVLILSNNMAELRFNLTTQG